MFWCWKWRWCLALGIFKRETDDGLPTCTTPEGPALACSASPRAVFQSYFLVVGTYLPKINYKNFDTLPRPSRVHHVAAEIHFFPAQKQHRSSRGLSIANAYQGNLRAALAAEDQLMEHTLVLQDLNDVLKSRALEGGWFVVVVVVVVVVLNLMWLIQGLLWLTLFLVLTLLEYLRILNWMVERGRPCIIVDGWTIRTAWWLLGWWRVMVLAKLQVARCCKW